MERIDKSFILSDFKEKEADLVYRVRLNGKDIVFYLLLELQSSVDFRMPYRLLQYMLEIWRTVLKDTDKNAVRRKGFRLPVIVPCVLYNGAPDWTACRSFRDTLEGGDMFEDYVLDFKYILFDVKRYGDQELEELGNLIGAAFFVDRHSDYSEFLVRIKRLIPGRHSRIDRA